MADQNAQISFPGRSLAGFIAGFFATLVFHQLALAILWAVGIAPFGPFSNGPYPTLQGAGGHFAGALGRSVGCSLCPG